MSDKPPSKGQLRQQKEAARLKAILDKALDKIPCFTGQMPAHWTDVFLAELDKNGAASLIPLLLEVARSKGYQFTDTPASRMYFQYCGGIASVISPRPADQTMGRAPQTYGTGDPNQQPSPEFLDYLEARYTAEMNASNYREASRIARDLAQIIDDAVEEKEMDPNGEQTAHGARLVPAARYGSPPPIESEAMEPPSGGAFR